MKKVLVIFGGTSSEHEVSCVSAYNVIKNLDKEKYIVSYMGIDKAGVWHSYTGNLENIKNNVWLDDKENLEEIKDVFGRLKLYDVAFPVLHGKLGEDGKIQGVFETAGVNYVGCKILGNAIGINKVLCKKLVSNAGISVVDYTLIDQKNYAKLDKEDKKNILENIKSSIGFPLIVKPNSEGSSIGVEKVDNYDMLENAINACFKYDNIALIEKYVDDRQEVECAVIEKDDGIFVSTPGEIISANEFYDYEAKYENSASYDRIPAEIDEAILNEIREEAKIIFEVLNLNSLARVDFFVSRGKVYFNEVNTMPGFTDISMYPKMLIHDGIIYSEILDILIENAINS